MKLTRQQFIDWQNKSITLLGMSGVGKTTLSSLLPSDQWFHYSGDYRIGTRYLNEAILDQVKSIAMEHPFSIQPWAGSVWRSSSAASGCFEMLK